MLSWFGYRREKTFRPGLTVCCYSSWQEELTTDRTRNQFVSHFLTLTATGRQWNQESWKKYRQQYGQKLQLFVNWIRKLQDNQERTLLKPKTNASTIYNDMNAV